MATIKSHELSATEKEVLLKFHKESRKDVIREIEELRKELNEIDERITILSGDADSHNVSIGTDQIKLSIVNGYDKTMPLPKKAVFILKELKKAVYVTDVFDRLAQYEPELKKDKVTAKNREAALYGAISYLDKKKIDLFRFKDKQGFLRVALLDWLDENGSLKNEYK